MISRKDLRGDRARGVCGLLSFWRQAETMKRPFAILALCIAACAVSGCAAVTAVGAIGSAGLSVASTAGGVAVSGVEAALTGASAAARATSR